MWPDSLVNHSVFSALEAKTLSAHALGKYLVKSSLTSSLSSSFGGGADQSIAPWRMNLLLNELGWVHKTVRGWQITPLGSKLGGEELQQAKTGLSYVVWPPGIIEQPQFKGLQRQLQQAPNVVGLYPALDGHGLPSDRLRQLDNWFYSAGLNHAWNRELPEAGLFCDFYLPQAHLYIDYWGYERTGQQCAVLSESQWLKGKMANKALYEKLGLNVLSLEPEHFIKDGQLMSLDDVLPKRLLQFEVSLNM